MFTALDLSEWVSILKTQLHGVPSIEALEALNNSTLLIANKKVLVEPVFPIVVGLLDDTSHSITGFLAQQMEEVGIVTNFHPTYSVVRFLDETKEICLLRL
jgi:hypothetical protein